MCVYVCVCAHMHLPLSHVWLFVTPWTVACQASLSIGFCRQEYWSGLHFLLQGIFLTQRLNPCLLCLLRCRQIIYLQNHTTFFYLCRKMDYLECPVWRTFTDICSKWAPSRSRPGTFSPPHKLPSCPFLINNPSKLPCSDFWHHELVMSVPEFHIKAIKGHVKSQSVSCSVMSASLRPLRL